MSLRTLIRKLSTQTSLKKFTAAISTRGKAITCPPLTDAINTFDDDITTKTASQAILQLVKRHMTKKKTPHGAAVEVLGGLNKIIPAVLRGISAQKLLMKKIRDHIATTYGAESKTAKAANDKLQYDRDRWQAEYDDYQRRVEEKNQNKMGYEIDDIYNAMDQGAASSKWAEQAVAVELAIGARIGEILAGSTFKALDKPGWIRQVGISKQYWRLEHKRKYVDKPVLHLSVAQVLGLVNEIRTALGSEMEQIRRGEKTAYDVSHSNNPRVNRAVRRLLPGSTSHDLRKIYGYLSYNLLADKAKWSEQSWLAKVLGHSNLDTAKSYSTVHIDVPKQEQENVEHKSDDVKADSSNNAGDIESLRRQLEELTVKIKNAMEDVKRPVATMTDIPRNPKKRDGRLMDYMAISAAAMRLNGVSVNRTNLRALGYGNSSITRYLEANDLVGKRGRKPKAKK